VHNRAHWMSYASNSYVVRRQYCLIVFLALIAFLHWTAVQSPTKERTSDFMVKIFRSRDLINNCVTSITRRSICSVSGCFSTTTPTNPALHWLSPKRNEVGSMTSFPQALHRWDGRIFDVAVLLFYWAFCKRFLAWFILWCGTTKTRDKRGRVFFEIPCVGVYRMGFVQYLHTPAANSYQRSTVLI
jgi:hypothetical protein